MIHTLLYLYDLHHNISYLHFDKLGSNGTSIEHSWLCSWDLHWGWGNKQEGYYGYQNEKNGNFIKRFCKIY